MHIYLMFDNRLLLLALPIVCRHKIKLRLLADYPVSLSLDPHYIFLVKRNPFTKLNQIFRVRLYILLSSCDIRQYKEANRRNSDKMKYTGTIASPSLTVVDFPVSLFSGNKEMTLFSPFEAFALSPFIPT